MPPHIGRTPRKFDANGLTPGQRIDLMLDILATITPPGYEFSLREIADVCGVSHEAIRQIEQRALAKLRRCAASPRCAGR